MKQALRYAAILTILMAPTLALAGTANSNVWSPSILKGPLITCTGDGGSGPGGGTQACTSLCDLVATTANVIYFFIGVVIWIVAPIMVAVSGILFMISRGNPGKLEAAKKTITTTIVGLLIVLSAYLIVYTFVAALNEISGGQTNIGGFTSGSPAACVPSPSQ